MSVIEKLDSVVKLCDAASAMVPSPECVAAIKQAETAAADFVIENQDAIRQDMIDARRYRVVRAMCCSAEGPSAGLASAWMIGDEKAADAVIDARLASDSEGGE